MNYDKLHKRIEYMLNYESDNYLIDINLKQEVSEKLFDFQFLHVFNLIVAFRTFYNVLDGSDTGTGKTYSAIALCKQNNYRPIIICPKGIISTWEYVCNLFRVNPLLIINYEMIKTGKINENYLTIDPQFPNEKKYRWNLPRDCILIFDEVHKCKNIKSENAKLLLSTKGVARVLMLSATVADKPESFAVFGYMLGFYKVMRQSHNWIKGMLREDKNYIGKQPTNGAINKAVFPSRGSRIRIQELGSKFPNNQISADCYDLDQDTLDEIDSLFEQLELNSKVLKSCVEMDKKGEVLAKITKARMQIEKLKIPIFIKLAKMYLKNDMAVVVFFNFKQSVRELADVFKTKCIVNGDMDKSLMLKNIEDFQSNKENIIVLTIQTGGTGISLHDINGKRRVSLISPTYDAINLKQALGRICRAGSLSPALQRIIFSTARLERAMCNNVKEKVSFIDNINDGDLMI